VHRAKPRHGHPKARPHPKPRPLARRPPQGAGESAFARQNNVEFWRKCIDSASRFPASARSMHFRKTSTPFDLVFCDAANKPPKLQMHFPQNSTESRARISSRTYNASMVSIATPLSVTLGETTFAIQDYLNQIFPALLPLIYVLTMFGCLKKGVSSTAILLIAIAVALVGVWAGVLG